MEFRVKLSRDTGANLPAALCEELLGGTFGRPGGLQAGAYTYTFQLNLRRFSHNIHPKQPLTAPNTP